VSCAYGRCSSHIRFGENRSEKGKSHPLSAMQFPLRLRDLHKQLFILDRDPARKHFHRIFEVAVEEDLPGAIDERRRSSVQDVETAAEGPIWRRCDRWVGIAKEHENVPDAELRREGDRVIEEGQVPAGPIGCGLDAEFSLRVSARFRGEFGGRVLTSFFDTSPRPSHCL
jgi:hypothetical protein